VTAAAAACAALAAMLLAACTTGGDPADGIAPPPASGSFDYQLGGASDLEDAPDVVVRDSSDAPLEGAYSVCYVNGFQTQPGDTREWVAEREHLLLHAPSGAVVTDSVWPDELILDPTTPEQRQGILDVLGPVIVGCADDGFDAVELDNLDTFTRDDGVPRDGAVALATAYVELAHEHGLAVAQKNTVELLDEAGEIGFDLAITEECVVTDECGAFADVYGDAVLDVEYTDRMDAARFAEVCASGDRPPLLVLRDRDLVPAGDSGYARVECD
jgi:hypothetical protein